MTTRSPVPPEETAWASEAAFRSGMRRLASGVCLISAGSSTAPVGLIATAVCSVSVDPPTLLASISRSAGAFETIEASGRFTVSILGTAHQEIMAPFTDRTRRGERFTGAGWLARADGPPLVEGALASFDCRVVERLAYATHMIFLARPMAITTGSGDPLVHFDRRFLGLG